jgi:hypothetical protein
VAGTNDDLALLAAGIAGTVEAFPEDGVTGIRLGGLLVPFYDRDADRLAAARETARTRPWESLRTVVAVLRGRLSEPQKGFLLEDSTQRRDLTRMLREVEDSLEDGEGRVRQAMERFRADNLEAAGRAERPFLRSGRGRILEIILAALLGATLAEALRRRPSRISPLITLAFSPVLASAVVLLLEGSSVLPVDPLRGISLGFLPISFSIGLGCAGLLGMASRLERLVEAAPETPVSRSQLHARPDDSPRGSKAILDRELLAQAPQDLSAQPPERVPSPDSWIAPPPSEVEVVEDPAFQPLRSAPPPATRPSRAGAADPSFRSVSEFLARQTEERLPFFPKRRVPPPE